MIEIEHLQKVVKQVTVLDIETLSIPAGTTTAITGLLPDQRQHLLDLFTGRTRPTAGTLTINQLSPTQHQKQLAPQLGILPAESPVYSRLTVRHNLTFYCQLYGYPAGRADQLLTQVGLADQASIRAGNLLPSLARRLAFGTAILHHPTFLLLNTPFADCDTASIDVLSRLIKQVGTDGATVVMLVSDPAGITHLSQTIHHFENGRHTHSYNPADKETNPNLPFKIPAKREDKVILVNPTDILYVTTEQRQTSLYTRDGAIPTHLTLSDIEKRLAHSGFFRAHRSYLVNLQHIKEVITYTRNSFALTLDDNTSQIPLSKNAYRDLRDLLNY